MTDDSRKYIAVSIKHSEWMSSRKWRFGDPLMLWGCGRTQDGEERSFSFYTARPWKAELYALGDFTKHGYNDWGTVDIKDDEPVKICVGFVKKYEDFDTVLVEEKDLLNYYRFCGLKEADEGEGNE